MKKLLSAILVLGLFIMNGCQGTEKYEQPAIKNDLAITSPKSIEAQSNAPSQKTQVPGIIDQNTWHYSIYDPLTKEIRFYDRNNNMLWRNFRY